MKKIENEMKSLLFLLSRRAISSPDADINSTGERAPSQIRHHEISGGLVDGIESPNAGSDICCESEYNGCR